MPALHPTEFHGRIDWLGTVPDRTASLRSQAVQSLQVGFGGPENETHGGETRLSCARVTAQHPLGTQIRNARQLSIVSTEELALIAAEIDLSQIDPSWLGATLVVSGIPDFTHLPPSSRLQGADGLSLVVDMENRPCHLPAKVIDADPDGQGAGRKFKAAAKGRRGVTAWVERPGALHLGEMLRLHIPDQPAWSLLGSTRDGFC